MGEITRNHLYTVDMDKPLMRQDCGVLLAEGDNNGDCFSFALNRCGVALDLDNAVSVTMYFVRQDGFTVFLDGECAGNRVNVTLPAHCYVVEGRFSLAVKASLTGETVTIAVIDGFIRSTHTAEIADPTEAIPSLDELFAQIEAMETATEETKAATENAKTITNAAINTMLDLMQTAAPVIIQSANGDGIVAVSDSAERTLSGLIVYGKTTQDGTPTPEVPAPLVNAGKDDIIRFYVRGKNLFQDMRTSTEDYTSNGITFVTNADGTFTANGTNSTTTRSSMTITAGSRWLYLPAGTYTVSSGVPNDDAYFQLSYNDEMVSAGSTAVYAYSTPKTFTIDKPKYAWMALNVKGGVTADNLVFKPQIEVGAVATEYEPYDKDGGQGFAVIVDEAGIPGIPVSSGGNYIDKNGQQWVCDEIDFTRKVYVQRLRTLTLDGSQSMRWYADERMPFGGAIQLTLSSNYHAAIPHRNKAISDRFVNKNNVAASFSHGVFGVTASGQSMFFGIEGVADADAAKTWFTAKPTSILYALATPIETPLPPEQIDTTTLIAQYPNTTAFNNAGADMKMEYIADTKIYIDQRIAALLNA